MKKTGIIIAVVFVVLISFTPFSSLADESAPDKPKPERAVSVEISVSILSAYISRGEEFSRNSMVVQPQVTASCKGVAVTIWGNWDTKPYSPKGADYSGSLNETDITLSYTNKIGIFQVTPGYVYYILNALNPDMPKPPDSQELFLTVQADTLLSPALTIYKDIAHYHQWYITLGLSHTFPITERVGLKLAAQAGYLKSESAATYPRYDANVKATADAFNNFHEGTISLSLPAAVHKNFTVTPTITYTFALSKDAEYAMKGYSLKGSAHPRDKDGAFLYGGVVLGYQF
jgi:hypothetical protein